MKKSNRREVKVLKGFPRFFEELGELREFTFLAIHTGPFCNFHCKKCFFRDKKIASTFKKPLSLNEWFSILEEAKNLGVKAIDISGIGEPLLDPNLKKIIRKANSLGFIITMATNGSLLNEDILKFFRENDVTLAISLDTLDPRKFAEFTGTNERVFNKVLKNIKKASEIFKGTKSEIKVNDKLIEVFRLAVHVTVSKENLNELEKLKEQFDSEDILFSTASWSEDEDVDFVNEEHITKIFNKEFGKTLCGFFSNGLAISFDGDLMVDSHAAVSKGVLGNIKDFNSLIDAFKFVKEVKKKLISKMKGFCPVREETTLDEFVKAFKNER